MICQFFVFLGALGLGVMGFYDIDPLKPIFGSITSIVYSTIGIAAAVLIALRFV